MLLSTFGLEVRRWGTYDDAELAKDPEDVVLESRIMQVGSLQPVR